MGKNFHELQAEEQNFLPKGYKRLIMEDPNGILAYFVNRIASVRLELEAFKEKVVLLLTEDENPVSEIDDTDNV